MKITSRELAMLIVFTQIGFAVFSLPLSLFMAVKQDAWMVVILTGLLTQAASFCIWSVYRLSGHAEDLLQVVFGKWLGGLFKILYILYSLFFASVILYGWIMLTKKWIYLQTPGWVFLILMSILIFYMIHCGIKTMVRVLPIALISLGIMLLFSLMTLNHFNFLHLLPVAVSPFSAYMTAVFHAIGGFLGFELLWRWLPITKGTSKQVLTSIIKANGLVTLFYVILTVLCTIFFGDEEFVLVSEPVLYLLKSNAFIVIERTDLLVLTLWIPLVLFTLSAYAKFATLYTQQLIPVISSTTVQALYVILCMIISLLWIIGKANVEGLFQNVIIAGIGLAYTVPLLAVLLIGVKSIFRRIQL